ncbi:MAG: cell filamentation protein Fic [Desulfuromonas sp. SDB]|nr:MAG: cell filamentation protein Fic [Desulfuromonas sp. SDB]
MKPPYKITNKILNLISKISEQIGEIKSARLTRPPTELRKKNRIKTIQSSLEIEGNSLTVEQVTDLINHKKVIAPEKDIVEVKNAILVYSKLDSFNTYDLDSLCYAHKLMMTGLVDNPGRLRTTSGGIVRGEKITHIAPSGEMIYPLLKDLFSYLKDDQDLLMIKSCVFHYEFEFIHPFTDGNGRIGRLWQTMILKEYSKVFEFLPVETLVKEKQQNYYNVLAKSDSQGTSTGFIEFMLGIIKISLDDLLKSQNLNVTGLDRINLFRDIIGEKEFSRKDYLRNNKDISSATASRDLKEAVDRGILLKTGDKRLTRYKFK